MSIIRWYKHPGLESGAAERARLQLIQQLPCGIHLAKLETELCYYIQLQEHSLDLTGEEMKHLMWVISTPFQTPVSSRSQWNSEGVSDDNTLLIEIGPRLNFCTAFSTNAVSICHSIGLHKVQRIEHSVRYRLTFSGHSMGGGDAQIYPDLEDDLISALHDKMTHCRYERPLRSFDLHTRPEAVYTVDVLGEGRGALEKANKYLGLAFDNWDLDYYTEMFRKKVERNPTSVECFDLAQSNSEHCRHWFFKGRMVIDGQEQEDSLFKMVMSTQEHSNQNNIIKFNDNSSGIVGYPVSALAPLNPAEPSVFEEHYERRRHIIFTAETHNFPTGVAPFPGSTTGTGGRIRDVHCTGRGAHVIAGTAGYSFGNLHIPGYNLPWEDKTLQYPGNFASPLNIAIQASDGASDYGNKFGEPVLTGFARSFGLVTSNGERREWIKPIMFSGGIGSLEDEHIKKLPPVKDYDIVKIGGPVYRIGVGGGAASSIRVQGDNAVELDYGAVQRGDAEMEQKLNRVIRSCIEMRHHNPICSIHDQGAGGNGNVLKEICEPAGAVIRASRFQLGDPTLSTMEIWGAEYQESNALLSKPSDEKILSQIGARERCPVLFVGKITDDGKICFVDDRDHSMEVDDPVAKRTRIDNPVDLDLKLVLGSMPRKVFQLDRPKHLLKPFMLPEHVTPHDALNRVLRLPSVASKRYLTNKVDRSVTGLVAQQQCVGPLHTPLADVAVVALSHFDIVGGATAIGEQPIKGLVDAACGARMSVGEALTNLVFARVSALRDVKCSGNWMWAAKLPGEGALLYDACRAMCDVMKELGIAIDGGKDSLSMAARVGDHTAKAPGTLVVSAYVGCPDIRATVTPDLKCPSAGKGSLLFVPLSPGNYRLGGSALAQCYEQIGDVSPDLDDAVLFSRAFSITQNLIEKRLLTAGHDVSDGGLLTCMLEMAFAGNCGILVDIPTANDVPVMNALFAEELGWILEVEPHNELQVVQAYNQEGVTCLVIGSSFLEQEISISINGEPILAEQMPVLRDVWEETSYQLEKLQANPSCVQQERDGLKSRRSPPYRLTFEVPRTMELLTAGDEGNTPLVAVIREEGSNGDREMVAAFHMAGFEVWDVNMQDLCSGSITLDRFRGVAFVGGFSYADVFGSAKGWAATLRFNDSVQAQFSHFYHRENTFSLGICNGCQLMTLLGWVGEDKSQPEMHQEGIHITHNESERFESRFVTVKIDKSPSIMLQGMEGSVLGIWVAHGEGRMLFKNRELQAGLARNRLLPIHYVDDDAQPTETYPLNPNGTAGGVAGLCSADGRHLAMMPHPERCVLPSQWPWMPNDWCMGQVSPWMQLFRNAYKWCTLESNGSVER